MLRINESWIAEDKRILIAVGDNNLLAAAVEGKNLLIVEKWEVLGPPLGESEAWVVCQTTGVFLFWGDLCRISWRWVRVKLHRVFEHFWHSNAPSGDVDNFLASYRCWYSISRPQIFSWLATGINPELKKGDRMATVSGAYLDCIWSWDLYE